MAETWSVRSQRSALEALTVAQDGDTIELAWPGATQFSKAAVESRAIGLGLDVVVMLAPERQKEGEG